MSYEELHDAFHALLHDLSSVINNAHVGHMTESVSEFEGDVVGFTDDTAIDADEGYDWVEYDAGMFDAWAMIDNGEVFELSGDDTPYADGQSDVMRINDCDCSNFVNEGVHTDAMAAGYETAMDEYAGMGADEWPTYPTQDRGEYTTGEANAWTEYMMTYTPPGV